MMNLDQAREVKHSMLWTYVTDEIKFRIDCLLKDLKACKPEELIGIQTELNTWEQALNLPQDVIEREEP